MKPRSLFFPLLLIGIGVLVFLANFGYVQGTAWGLLFQYWPAVLIIGGLDGLYRRDGWIGPLVLIGFGGVLLLGNLGYFSQNAWELLLRLWPIFLVGLGLDLTFGRGHSSWMVVVKVLVGLALVAAIVWLALATPFGTIYHPVTVSQAVNGATSSSLQFSMAAGEFEMKSGTNPGTLVSGTVSLPTSSRFEPTYTAPKNGQSMYFLQGPGVIVGTTSRDQMLWDLAVTPAIPLDVRMEMGVGDLNLDLTGTRTQTIKANLGVGKITIDLPSGESINGSINTAVGEIVLGIPTCAAVNISMERGISDLQLPAGYANVNGQIVYQAPQGCANNVIDLNVGIAIGNIRIVRMP